MHYPPATLAVIALLLAAAFVFYRGVEKPGWTDRISLAGAALSCFSLLLGAAFEIAGFIYLWIAVLPFGLLASFCCLALPPYRNKGKAGLVNRAASFAVCLAALAYAILRDILRSL